jgi:hypothetical protein
MAVAQTETAARLPKLALERTESKAILPFETPPTEPAAAGQARHKIQT